MTRYHAKNPLINQLPSSDLIIPGQIPADPKKMPVKYELRSGIVAGAYCTMEESIHVTLSPDTPSPPSIPVLPRSGEGRSGGNRREDMLPG